MFSSPILEKGFRFTSPVLEKGSIGSLVQYWKRFYRFTSPVLGKGSIGYPVQFWGRFLDPQTSTGIGSIGSSDQYWEKVLKVPQSNTEKRLYRFPSSVLEKGSVGSLVQYCKRFCRFPSPVLGKVLCSPIHYWEKVL